jgi:hypothetical protein
MDRKIRENITNVFLKKIFLIGTGWTWSNIKMG